MKNLLIEIGNQAFEAYTGFIKFFSKGSLDDEGKEKKGYGYIEVPGHPDVRYEKDALCLAVPGTSYPRVGESADLTRMDVVPGTPVIFRAPVEGRNGGFWTDAVLSQSSRRHGYDQVAEDMAQRPVFRVLHINGRFKGQFAGGTTRESVYIDGTREAIEAKHPRLAPNDPLAPIYKTYPVMVHAIWQRKNKEGTWENCDDPRNCPIRYTRIQVRVFESVDQKPIQRLHGHLGLLFERPYEFLGEQFSFEIRTGKVGWTEISDPRRKQWSEPKTETVAQPVNIGVQPDRKSATKPGEKSVAPPKSNKVRRQVFTSLSELRFPTV